MRALRLIRSVQEEREVGTSRSPHLWGRCPAGQRGVNRALRAPIVILSKTPTSLLRRLRRSRGSICPWLALFSGSTALSAMVCRTGRCKLPRWGRIVLAPFSAPFSGFCPPAILLPRLAHPGRRRAETLPVHRSDMFKVQPFTSGQQRASLPKRPACHFGHICPFSPFEDARQMQRLPVYRLTFASNSSRSRSTRSR
jgi:hypothetical protein